MLFNSLEFLVFFPLVTLLYFVLPARFRWFHLLAASCVFYMFFVPVYILILAFTIVIDYFAGIFIEQAEGKKKKNYLIISLFANIGVLAVFKYYNFFIDNINTVLPTSYSLLPLSILLPIGLSFHTFQAMSYTIEVYRGNQKAERHFGIYALYVMFYPQLVAGPIERPQNLLGQFRQEHRFNATTFIDGMRLIIWGLFKKLVIADRVAIYVNGVFNQPDQHSSPTLLMAAVLFSFQIYCDFSGYSDIAIGTARTMGFKLMTNFKRPYFATNIREFWARWHISLSTWFRDYVYIPLGGNRVARSRMYFNLFMVFLLSGLWHGANWTFVIWGAIHACLIVGYQLVIDYKLIPQFSNRRANPSPILKFSNWFFTFLLVSLAWVFFRANSVAEAVQILAGIADWHGTLAWRVESGVSVFSSLSLLISLIAIGFMLIVEWFYTPEMTELKHRPVIDLSFATICLVVMLTWGTFNKSMFIYFQF